MPPRNIRKKKKNDGACKKEVIDDVKTEITKRPVRRSRNKNNASKEEDGDFNAIMNQKVLIEKAVISPAAKLAAKRDKCKMVEGSNCLADNIEKKSSKYFDRDCNALATNKRGRSQSVLSARDRVDEKDKHPASRSRSAAAGRGSKRNKTTSEPMVEVCPGVVNNSEEKETIQEQRKRVMEVHDEVNTGQDGGVIDENIAPSSSNGANVDNRHDEEMSESESDWEEVEEVASVPEKSQIPKAPVEIVLQEPDIKKRRKKKMDIETYFRQLMNRFRKATQLDVHKVHLLCLFAHGFHRNTICNDDTLRAVALSVVPARFVNVGDDTKCDMKWLMEITDWFSDRYRLDADVSEDNSNLLRTLLLRLENYIAASEAELVFIFVLTLRALGLAVRTLCSFHPVTYKANDLILTAAQKSNAMKRKKATETKRQKSTAKKSTKIKRSPGGFVKNGKSSDACPATSGDESPLSSSSSSSGNAKTNILSVKDIKNCHLPDMTSATAIVKPANRHPRKCSAKVTYNDGNEDMEDEEEDGKRQQDVRNEDNQGTKDENVSAGVKKRLGKRKAECSRQKKRDSSDEDFQVDQPEDRVAKKIAGKDGISDSDESVAITEVTKKNGGIGYWAEVYIENSWTCVDCVRNRVGHPEEMEPISSTQFSFVLAYDDKGHVKDMTRRYAHDWLLHTQKLRGDSKWWDSVLKPYEMTAEDNLKEEELLQAKLLEQPLPKAIADYKNHPLYVLKRHLLKFEAIYPNSAVPLGYVRNDPVYARECVHTLHARETWLKEGRVVKPGEEPYKMVKARPKWHKPQPQSTEPTLPIFGLWQTEPYVPPPAVDGKVPRNEYGNVELFKPSMLPAGTVHLRLPGLQKIAKKLDIDCASAMVGWEFHKGFNHPTMDGYIVCTEYKDILLAAWDEQQEIERENRAKEREQQAVDHWKLLTKGLLIKERLKDRYQLQAEPKTTNSTVKTPNRKRTKGQTCTKSNDVALSWPQNKQKAPRKTKKQKETDSYLFPFEVEQEKL